VEHANSEVVGIHASRSASRFEALEPIRQGVHRCFGEIGPGVARGLKLRHDHGSNYMSGDFQEEIECLSRPGKRRNEQFCSSGWSSCRFSAPSRTRTASSRTSAGRAVSWSA
jgi:hypothetical protein